METNPHTAKTISTEIIKSSSDITIIDGVALPSNVIDDTRFVSTWGEWALEDCGMLTHEITPFHIEEILRYCIEEYKAEGRMPKLTEDAVISDIVDEGAIGRAAEKVFKDHIDKILLEDSEIK